MSLTGNVIDVQKIQLTDTFQTWFAKTNEMVDALNPVNIYDIDDGAGTNVTYGVTGTAYNGVKYVNVNAGYGVAVGGGSAKPWTGVVGLDYSSISGNAYTLTGNEQTVAPYSQYTLINSEVADSDYFLVLDTTDTTQTPQGTVKRVKAQHMLPRTISQPSVTLYGDLRVKGSLSVDGTGSSLASNTLAVASKYIYLAVTGASSPQFTASTLNDAGLVIGISGGLNKEIVWYFNSPNTDYITLNSNYGAKSITNALVNSKFISRNFVGGDGATSNAFVFEAAGGSATRMWFTESGSNPYFGIVKDSASSNVNFNVYNGAGITSVAYIIAGATSQYTGVTANAFIRFANVDMVDGAHAATGASAWTIPVTDQLGQIFAERHNAGQIKRRFTQASHGLTTGQAVAVIINGAAVGTPGTITGADANSTSTEAIGIVDRVISTSEVSVTMKGYMDLSPNGLLGIGTPVTGQVYYLDWVVKGGLTTNTNVPQGKLYQPLFMTLGASAGIVYGNEADVIFPFAQDQVYMRGMVPIGVIQPYAGGLAGLTFGLSGGSIPVSDVQYNDNWMPCDGRALPATGASGFVDLFNLINYTYSMRGVVQSPDGALNTVIRPDRGTANLGSLGLGSLAGVVRVIKRGAASSDSPNIVKTYSYTGLTADGTTITFKGLTTNNVTIASNIVVDILSPKDGSYFFAPDLRGKAPFGEYAPYGARGEGFSLTAGATGGTATGDGGLFTNYLIRAKRDSDAMILTGHNHDSRYLRKDVTDTVSPAGTTLNLQNVEIAGILGSNDNIGIGMSPLSKSNGYTGFALSVNRAGNFGTWVSAYNGNDGIRASAGYRANNGVGDATLYLSRPTDSTFILGTSEGCSGGILFSAGGNTGSVRIATVNTERMRITPTGNVGIGTLAPAAKLQTEAANNAARFGVSNVNALTIGRGGSQYCGIGYNVNFDSGSDGDKFFAVGGDRTSLIRFKDGGFEFKGNASNGAVSGTPFALTDYMTILNSGNVGIGTNNPVEKLTIVSNTDGYTGGIVNSNTQSGSYLRIAPLGTNTGVTQWATSSVVFEGLPASSGNTILGSYNSDLVFQTGIRTDRMRITNAGTLIHNGFALPSSPGAIGAISFVPSSVNPIYNRIVFGGDNTGYGLAIASQHKTTNVVTDRLVIYDNGRINIPGASASTSTATGALTVAGGVGIAGTLNVGGITTSAVNVSTLGKFARISVHSDGTSDVNINYRISARANSSGSGAVLGYINANDTIFGILGHADAYSFYGNGTLYNSGALNNTGILTNTGGITATGSITPGAWANGSSPRSYISTVAPAAGASFPTAGSIWFVV